MYLKLTLEDKALVRQLAQLLQHRTYSACAPAELALLFSAQEAFDWREGSFNAIIHQLGDELERHPARTLMRLKSTIQKMSHRLVELDDRTSILISKLNQDTTRLPSVGVLETKSRASIGEAPKFETSVLGSTELRAFVDGMQREATRKVADTVLQVVNDGSDIGDVLEDADLPTMVHVAHVLWEAQRDGCLTNRNYEQVASKLFRVSGMRILHASAVFTIPGLGPGIAALLFAHRIEQFR